MPLKTTDFFASVLVSQPDGITPVISDIEVVITNDGAFSNGGGSFKACGLVSNGKAIVSFNNLVPAPDFSAAEGDTLTVELRDLNTKEVLLIKNLGNNVPNITRLLTAQDIIAQNGNVNDPKGKVEFNLVLAFEAKIHSDDILFRGDIFQPDGTTPPPLGLEVRIENLTKNTTFVIADNQGDYFQNAVVPPGFDSGDILRMSVRNAFSGQVLTLKVATSTQTSISRALQDRELIALGVDPNKGEVVQNFVLNEDFEGLLLPPNSLIAESGDHFVSLRWSRVFNPTLAGFIIERSIRSSGPFFRVNADLVEGTSYVDRGLINGISYYYRIITVLDNNDQSRPSSVRQGTPNVTDNNFSMRQMVNERFVASRDLNVSAKINRISGPATALTIKAKYLTIGGDIDEFIIGNPNITSVGNFTTFTKAIEVPLDAYEILDVRFVQDAGSSFVVDSVTMSLRGLTTDAQARLLIAPSINSDNTKILLKNTLPGDLILFDIESRVAERMVALGAGFEPANATNDPAEWFEEDETIVYTYLTQTTTTGIFTELRKIRYNRLTFAPGIPETIPDTALAEFPKASVPARSCTGARNIIFWWDQNGSPTGALKEIGLNNDNTARIVMPVPKTLKHYDIDTDGNIAFSTDAAIFVNGIEGGVNKQVLDRGSSWIQWGNKKFSAGRILAYQRDDVDFDINSLVLLTDVRESLSNTAEYILDTSVFPDGPLNIRIRGTDGSANPQNNTVEINTIVNNSINLRPMLATSVTDPGTVTDTTGVTAPGAIVGGITNKCTLMSAGLSSANRGRLEFLTRDTNQLMTTLEDTFTQTPVPTVRQMFPDPTPMKMRFTWLTNLINSEPGGHLNPCILTVNIGGITRNIFIPEIEAAANNQIILYIGHDGSTYFDPQLRLLAREATDDPLVKVAPELDPVLRYTRTNTVNLTWCLQPGASRDSIARYRILRSTEPNIGYEVIFTSADNTACAYPDPNIVDGTAYFYRIEAIDLLGNVIPGAQTQFTVVDRTGAIEKLGFLQVDLNIDDARINEDVLLEPGTGKVFPQRTTFNLNAVRNTQSPPINFNSKVYADYTFQKARDIKLRLPPVERVDSVVGEVSGPFVQNRDYLFVKDDGIQSGSVRAKELVRFIRQKRSVIEEEVVRGTGPHSADGLDRLFVTDIDYVSMAIKISSEPVTPVAGFLLQLTNTEPGRQVNGKRQVVLEVYSVRNKTTGISYEINDVTTNYNANPALIQLDIFTNMGRFPFPDPTHDLVIDYSFLFIFPKNSYQLDRSMNAIRWLGPNAQQPREGQRYLVSYQHMAPIPRERITLSYTTNSLIRTLQSGDIQTGLKGLDEKRHICADVLARETIPVPIDVELDVRLYDTADEGFVTNEINQAVADLFANKKLGQGIRISDIACAVQELEDVESVKLDPVAKVGRVDLPYFLKMDVSDVVNFSVHPGRVEGEVTFYTHSRPTSEIVIPSGTIVSNDFNFVNDVLLFETTSTFRAPMDIIDSRYNRQKDRYEFNVPVRALFEGSVSVNRFEINTIGGVLKNWLGVENEAIIEGAVQRQEVITGNGSLTLTPNNGQLMGIISVQNFSTENVEEIPTNANFIKLDKEFITNARGDDLGSIGNSSVIIDDGVVFAQEVANPPAAPGQYFVNYEQGYIQTYTKTAPVANRQKIRYTYKEIYNLDFTKISDDRTSFTMNGPANANKPLPKFGDYILADYRWGGDGVPLKYRLETFSNPDGVIDLSFIKANDFVGKIFLNDRTEFIENVTTHPEPPFYAFDKTTRQMSIVGRPLTGNEEIIFRFSTPFGDIDLAMTTFDLQTRNNVSRFTFNVDAQAMNIDLIKFLEMGGDSVQDSPGMIINAGLPKTKEREVVIQLAAVNAKDMIFSEDSLFRDRTEIDYEPFSTAKLFKLSDGDDVKRVYARVRFENTGVKDYDMSQTITLDKDFNEGEFIPLDDSDFLYSRKTGILRLPTSFGQSDVNINDMQSIKLNSVQLNYASTRAKRVF